MIKHVTVATALVVALSGCDKLPGTRRYGTCVDAKLDLCFVHERDVMCKARSRGEFFSEDGAAGVARCKALGYDLPQSPLERQKAEEGLRAGTGATLSKRQP